MTHVGRGCGKSKSRVLDINIFLDHDCDCAFGDITVASYGGLSVLYRRSLHMRFHSII